MSAGACPSGGGNLPSIRCALGPLHPSSGGSRLGLFTEKKLLVGDVPQSCAGPDIWYVAALVALRLLCEEDSVSPNVAQGSLSLPCLFQVPWATAGSPMFAVSDSQLHDPDNVWALLQWLRTSPESIELSAGALQGTCWTSAAMPALLASCKPEFLQLFESWGYSWVASLEASASAIRARIWHDPAQLPTDVADRLLEVWVALTQAAVAMGASATIGDLLQRLRTCAEEVHTGRSSDAGNSADNVVSWFESAASEYPDKPAIVRLLEHSSLYDAARIEYALEKTTFSMLNARANQVARCLLDCGVRDEEVVGLLIDDVNLKVQALLGVLKSGAAYLALDRRFSPTLAAELLVRAGTRFLLVDDGYRDYLPAIAPSIQVLPCESSRIGHYPTQNLALSGSPAALAYVCYTSGSTGPVKGVLVEHAGLSNYVRWRRGVQALGPHSVSLQLIPWSADAHGANLFPLLCAGGTVAMVPESRQADPIHVAELVARVDITTLSITPGALSRLIPNIDPTHFTRCTHLILGGEEATKGLLTDVSLLLPGCQIANEYGPTEATIAATFNPGYSPDQTDNVGTPIDNFSVALVSATGQRVPQGLPGEVVLFGAGVARGYLDDPKLTRSRFLFDVPHFPEGRGYRTGDVAYFDRQGNLRILGRLDDQVKIAGSRVNLGAVARSIAVLCGEEPTLYLHAASSELIAQLRGPIVAGTKMREQLEGVLPAWMLPRIVSADSQTADTIVSSLTPTEAAVLEIFAKVLRVDSKRLSAASHFFELGGHSLSVTQVAALIHTKFKVSLRLTKVYENPTVALLAKAVDSEERAAKARRSPAAEALKYPMSSAQARMYMMRHTESPDTAFNVSFVAMQRSYVDHERLTSACNQLIGQHASLRSVFGLSEAQFHQQVLPSLSIEVPIVRLNRRDLPEFCRTLRRPFDLGRGPLLRVWHVIVDDCTAHLVLIDTHHIIVDGRSADILIAELACRYDERPVAYPTGTYREYVEAENSYLTTAKKALLSHHWSSQLAGYAGAPDISDPAPHMPRQHGFVYFHLDATLLSRLFDRCRWSGASPGTVLLGCHIASLCGCFGCSDLVVSQSVSGRDAGTFDGVVGMFANFIPVRASVPPNATFSELLRLVKERCDQALQHQDLPINCIVDAVRQARGAPETLLQFTYQYGQGPSDGRSVGAEGLRRLDEKLQDSLSDEVKFDIRPSCKLLLWIHEIPGLGASCVIGYNGYGWSRERAEERVCAYRKFISGVADGEDPRIIASARMENQDVSGFKFV